MRQECFCPQCRALIGIGDRFCSNCGIHLNWVIVQTSPGTSGESYSYGYPDQQKAQEMPLHDEQTRGHHQTIPHEAGNISQKCGSTAGGTATPISTEISRLLTDFFNKQINNN
jgi:hypothetical protein